MSIPSFIYANNHHLPYLACAVYPYCETETVLGKAAMYLNARIPELTSIRVASPDELADFEDIVDEYTGEVIYR
jgi:hypothetical protein